MSRKNSPYKGSPGKQVLRLQRHKGLKTSLYKEGQKYPAQLLQSNRHFTANNPSRIFVQTTAQQPNVLPYINSDYSSQPQMVNPANSQYVIGVGRQNNLMSGATRPHVVMTNVRVSPVVSNQDLSRTKVEAPYQSRVPQINNASTYVPPPPQSFLIPNSASKIVQTRPMGRSVIHSIPVANMIPVQNVKKTFIPHHIINQIPVYPGTVYTELATQQQGSVVSNDESQQVLMGYYEKLYAKYEAQKERSAEMSQQLGHAVDEINYWKSQVQSQQTTQQNVIPSGQKRKVVDKRRLHDLLMSKLSPIIDRVLESRKSTCLHQVTNLIQSRRINIKIPTQSHHQQQQQQYMSSRR